LSLVTRSELVIFLLLLEKLRLGVDAYYGAGASQKTLSDQMLSVYKNKKKTLSDQMLSVYKNKTGQRVSHSMSRIDVGFQRNH